MPVSTSLVPHRTKPPAIPVEPIWRLHVDQYHEMIEAGILTPDDPVELLDGWLITKMPKSPRHTATTQDLRDALDRLLPSGWFINAQEPITLEDSEPEPDVIVVRGNRHQYLDRHPGPREVALVIEVSDATLRRDRTLKRRLYAEAGLATYWIVDLQNHRVEVWTNPEAGTYQQHQAFGPSDYIPVILDGEEVGRLSLRAVLPYLSSNK